MSRAIAVPGRVLDLLGRVDLSRLAPTATVYVHLHQGAVEGTTGGVARVEGLGPLLLEQVRGLLGHTNVALKPVVDLADRVSVNAYEHPETVKERVHLRTLGEVFPYGRATGRNVDMDHPVPYDPLGPPGQTGDDNAGPLSRQPAPGQDPPGVPGHPDRPDRVRLVDPARPAPPGRRARHPPPDRRGRRAPHRGPARDRRSRVGPPLGPGRRPARRAPPHRKARSRRLTRRAVTSIRSCVAGRMTSVAFNQFAGANAQGVERHHLVSHVSPVNGLYSTAGGTRCTPPRTYGSPAAILPATRTEDLSSQNRAGSSAKPARQRTRSAWSRS